MVKRTTKLYKLSERFGKNKAVKAGVLADKKYPDGTSVAQVAFDNEYGNKEAPPRPFFRNSINENKDKWRDIILNLLKGGDDVEKALGILGDHMASDIKRSIYEGNFQRNSPVTLLLKERFPQNPEAITDADFAKAVRDVQAGITAKGDKDKPLQWTGTLRESISWRVDDEP